MRTRMPICILVLLAVFFSSPSFAQTSDDLFNGDVLHEIRLYVSTSDIATLKLTNFTCQEQDLKALAGEVVSALPRVECHFPVEFHWTFNGKDITGPQAALS